MARQQRISVRTAVPADAPAIADLHKASIREVCGPHYTPGQIRSWADPKRPADYEPGISSGALLVAEIAGEVVGFSLLDVAEAEIRALYVHPASVGRGAGAALLGVMESKAMEKGIARLVLNATLNSVGFYERNGYTSRGRSWNRLPSGEDLPCMRMEKRLA